MPSTPDVSKPSQDSLPYSPQELDQKLYSCAYDASGKLSCQKPGASDNTSDLGKLVKPGDDIKMQIPIDGKQRDVYVHIPKNYDPKKPMPLMLLFNGAGPGAKGMASFTGMSEKADKEGFIVAYPDGTGTFLKMPVHTFNTGEAMWGKDNDVKFTEAVIDKLEATLPVNRDELWFVGFSQGGNFMHTAAAELPPDKRPKKMAGVEDWMNGREQFPTKDGKPAKVDPKNPLAQISEMSIHGTDDWIVDYGGTQKVIQDDVPKAMAVAEGTILLGPLMGGGALAYAGAAALTDLVVDGATNAARRENGNSKISATPVEAVAAVLQVTTTNLMPQKYTFDYYKAANGANVDLPNIEGNGYYAQRAINPLTGKEVELVTVPGGQHESPGSKDHSGDIPLIGQPTDKFSATDLIYNFLSKQPKPAQKPDLKTIKIDAHPFLPQIDIP